MSDDRRQHLADILIRIYDAEGRLDALEKRVAALEPEPSPPPLSEDDDEEPTVSERPGGRDDEVERLRARVAELDEALIGRVNRIMELEEAIREHRREHHARVPGGRGTGFDRLLWSHVPEEGEAPSALSQQEGERHG